MTIVVKDTVYEEKGNHARTATIQSVNAMNNFRNFISFEYPT